MKKYKLTAICLLLSLFLSACAQNNERPAQLSQKPAEEFPMITTAPDGRPTSPYTKSEPQPIHRSERPAGELPAIDVKTIYLTVKEGSDEETNHTWEEINNYSADDYASMGIDRYKISGWISDDPDSADTNKAPNCTVSFRGQSSSRARQKSYKIKLDDDEWMNQKTLNLNKHYYDSSRILNKLAYDLINEIPEMIGLKTQFVRLYVKDLSNGSDPAAAQFTDYGLFTHVEQLNNKAIKRLKLDKEGSLYKVSAFEFWEYDDIKLTTDPKFDINKFEVRMENKGETDNEKLISLMDAVNDTGISNSEILDNYVEIDNVAYWMAFQILIDNVDTNCRNFYLYSPSDSQKWYIISWDNDGAFSHYKTENSSRSTVPWRYGIADYWGNLLFRRLLKTPEFRNALAAAAVDLRNNYLTDKHVAELIDLYRENIDSVIYEGFDGTILSKKRHEQYIEAIVGEIDKNYNRLMDSLQTPMPFFIGSPELKLPNEISLIWDESYDPDGNELKYVVEVSDDYEFKNILFTKETKHTDITFTHEWNPGIYYIRVTVKNSLDKTMTSFNSISVEGYGSVYSTVSYTVK